MKLVALLIAALIAASSPALAEADKGKETYQRLCAWCHGAEGAGDGPAAEYLNPPPRDFTMGLFKWKSTPFDEMSPTEEDISRMITGAVHPATGWDGLGGTSMPGWADVLAADELRGLSGYVLSLGGLQRPEKAAVAVPKRAVDLDAGRRLFEDRCAECHGRKGRGDAAKKLRDDWGARTWPRDLTKEWTFRAGGSVDEIYRRVTIGIPGTQMPSFADPVSKKAMTEDERWNVASYAALLDEPGRRPGRGAVIRAARAYQGLPTAPDDGRWAAAQYASFHLVPQMVAGDRAYTPSIDAATVKALYDDGSVALLIEWDDPTNSMPWDEKSRELAEGEAFPDGFAVEFAPGPVREGERPYFGMGGPKPVVIWSWQGGSAQGPGQRLKVIDARGYRSMAARADAPVSASGSYEDGRWRLVVTSPLKATEGDPVFEEGRHMPVAFAAWDGSNGDSGGRHVMTGWQWMVLEAGGEGSRLFWPVAAGGAVLVLELAWLFGRRRGRPL